MAKYVISDYLTSISKSVKSIWGFEVGLTHCSPIWIFYGDGQGDFEKVGDDCLSEVLVVNNNSFRFALTGSNSSSDFGRINRQTWSTFSIQTITRTNNVVTVTTSVSQRLYRILQKANRIVTRIFEEK